jgi:hypothetical protein
MLKEQTSTYPPLNTLNLVSEDIWIVNGPAVRFGPPLLRMPFSTRMSIIKLAGGIFIHSPTLLVPSLKAEIDKIGDVKWIIAPNRLHYTWVQNWAEAFPNACVYLASGIEKQARDRISISGLSLDKDCGYPWDGEIATLPIVSSYMTEVEFFHYASRTLILTDLIENFEPNKLVSFAMRLMTYIGSAQDPSGSMPRDMRMTFAKCKPHLRGAIEKMISWNPDRIILAHGRWYRKDGTVELERAFEWLGEFHKP